MDAEIAPPATPRTKGTKPLAVGTPVNVNGYHGVVRSVITGFSSSDPFRGRTTEVRLGHPVYEIELDTTRRFSWSNCRIRLPVGVNTIRLFADEFEVLKSQKPE